MHHLTCVFNPTPDFPKYLRLYKEYNHAKVGELSSVCHHFNEQSRGGSVRIGSDNSVLTWNDTLVMELSNCETFHQRRQVIQIVRVFHIDEFMQRVQQDFSHYDFFTNQENLRLRFKRFIPTKKELLSSNLRVSDTA